MGNINCMNIKCYISGYGARGGHANGQGPRGNGLLSTDVCTGHMMTRTQLWSWAPCVCSLAHLGSTGNKPMKGNGQPTYGTHPLLSPSSSSSSLLTPSSSSSSSSLLYSWLEVIYLETFLHDCNIGNLKIVSCILPHVLGGVPAGVDSGLLVFCSRSWSGSGSGCPPGPRGSAAGREPHERWVYVRWDVDVRTTCVLLQSNHVITPLSRTGSPRRLWSSAQRRWLTL